jgi:hypothetical protein
LENGLLEYCFDRVLRAGPPVIGGGATEVSTGDATVIGLK